MTPPKPLPIVYFHPICGWYSGSGPLTEEEAECLCREQNIPYRTPPDAPDRFDPVLDADVAGLYYVKDIEDILSGLEKSQMLEMVREDNPHDPNAVMIVDEGSRKVGYVPKGSNQVIAKLMDLGERFIATVVKVDPDAPELKVTICMRRGRCTRRHFSISYDSIAGAFLQMDNVPVTKRMFGFKAMSGNRREVSYKRMFTPDEMWDMRWGHLSESMDDRWNIVCMGRRLHFCRSWTGNCVFTLVFGKNDEHRLMIENDPSVCSIDDESAIETMDSLLDSWLQPIGIPSNQIPNGVFGNFVELPPTDMDTKYSINTDGTVRISVLR